MQSQKRIPMTCTFLAATLLAIATTSLVAQSSSPLELDENWEVSLDGGSSWQPITVPGTIEDQIDVNFDGVSIYRTRIPARVPAGKSAILRFGAVATHADVSINGNQVGTHLGGWTPFEFDISSTLIDATEESVELKVVVDERVGHNTQGFLPIIAPHFGGVWKPVQLHFLPAIRPNADQVRLTGRLDLSRLEIEMPVRSSRSWKHVTASARARLFNPEGQEIGWTPETEILNVNSVDAKSFPLTANGSLAIQDPAPWSPETPNLYEVEIKIVAESENGQKVSSSFRSRTGFREFSVDQRRLRLNNRTLIVRGLLNWGYCPPQVAPSLDESWMRREIEFAKKRGFNLMKFCLWIPPKRYLELCDEMGMLAWVEYPAWHPDFSAKHLGDLKREYLEFFQYDRNHPSVILRSLTCETGPSASIEVIQSLYDLCKQQIPNAVVEDDSSWIQWNRVHDFYDDHPYGNNHTWPATLNRLTSYIAQRSIKPLVLGESIAADTWVDPADFMNSKNPPETTPFHRPWFVESNHAWLEWARSRNADLSQFKKRTRNYAHLMRKSQIETYRRMVPTGGYVVSVIRDFPKAAMGLIDYHGRSKWTEEEWAFHSDICLTLDLPEDRRGISNRNLLKLPIQMTGDTSDLQKASLTISVTDHRAFHAQKTIGMGNQIPDALPITKFSLDDSGLPGPGRLTVAAELLAESTRTGKQVRVTNRWPLWRFPEPRISGDIRLQFHSSVTNTTDFTFPTTGKSIAPRSNNVTLTRHLTPQLLQEIKEGGKVILFPNNQKHSFPTADHWFLRGGPAVFRNKSLPTVSTEMLMELQHFDLAGPVVPNLADIVAHIDPMLMLWDNHDMRETRTHGLVFSMGIGKGQMIVSALNHTDRENIAGQWLLCQLVNHLAKSNPAETSLSQENARRLESELGRTDMSLHQRKWKFQPDPDAVGERDRWFQPNFDDSHWTQIQADRHWDSQGFAELDGWGWYRLNVKPDPNGQGKLFLNFTGVDDHFRVWVNGKFLGQAGVIETKETAFDMRKSFEIPPTVPRDRPMQITVGVYDWYGAGGIFRPVTLSTTPLSESRPWLKH